MSDNIPTEREVKVMLTEAGWLGRCFGSRRNAPTNIVGAVVLGFVLLGAAAMFFGTVGIAAAEYWALVVPAIVGMAYVLQKMK